MTQAAKKQAVGNFIFNHVASLVGTQWAPKIVGMIIELPMSELMLAMKQWNFLEEKIAQGMDLIK